MREGEGERERERRGRVREDKEEGRGEGLRGRGERSTKIVRWNEREKEVEGRCEIRDEGRENCSNLSCTD